MAREKLTPLGRKTASIVKMDRFDIKQKAEYDYADHGFDHNKTEVQRVARALTQAQNRFKQAHDLFLEQEEIPLQ